LRRRKSQIQALDRTQPGLPIKKGRCGTMTRDYKRDRTTTLFAALEILPSKVIGKCYQRHRHQEFIKFLRRLDAEFPGDIPLHLIMDNYGTHKHAKVQAWMTRHPRFVAHFVPTSSSRQIVAKSAPSEVLLAPLTYSESLSGRVRVFTCGSKIVNDGLQTPPLG
jgi:hypothetical protein